MNELSRARRRACLPHPTHVVAEVLEARTMLAISFGDPQPFTPLQGRVNQVAVGDFNNDGIHDIAALSPEGGLGVLVGSGDGNFGTAAPATTQHGLYKLAVSDFNGDGNDDLVTLKPATGDLLFFFGNGDTTFDPASLHVGDGMKSFLLVGDFNGDTRPDIAASLNSNDVGQTGVEIFINDGTGAFLPPAHTALGQWPSYGAAGDFDGDGRDDLAVTDWASDNVTVLANDGGGGFKPPIAWPAGGGVTALAAADVNDDGRLDLLAAGQDGNVRVLIGNGGGGFSAPQVHPVGDGDGTSIVAGDFDADGDADVATAVKKTGFRQVFVLPNTGAGDFGNPVQLTFEDQGSISLAVGQLGGDGKPDLVAGHWDVTVQNVGVLLNETLSVPAQFAKWLHLLLPEGAAGTTRLAKVKVTLPLPQRVTASLRYATADGTASVRAGDYTPASGVLTFRPGETVKEVLVPVRGDAAVEGDEQFFVDFSEPMNLSLTQRRAAVTIGDDDGPGRLSFARPVFTAGEDGRSGTATVTVERAGGAEGVVTVEYLTANRTALAGADYAAVNGRLVFQPGQTTATFEVPVLDDGLREPAETAGLLLRNPGGGASLGGPDTAELRVLDDEPHVVGRHLFYNNSAFDGFDPRATAADDGAIAPDKVLLSPGQPPSFRNVTSFVKGINGLMLDAHLTLFPLGTLDMSAAVSDDRTGALEPAPPYTLSVRRGAGAGGSDRVTLVWPDGAIVNKTVHVFLKANAATGLSRAEYFGATSLVGETGDDAAPAGAPAGRVTVLDALRARRALFSSATITSRYDFNRDGRVSPVDLAVVRSALTRSLPPRPSPPPDSTSPLTAMTPAADEVLPEGGDPRREMSGWIRRE